MTTSQILDRIAVITLNNPPINSLGHATRATVEREFRAAAANPAVDAIIFTGGNGILTGGADIKEFGLEIGMRAPNLHDLIRLFEQSAKPVISAINGTSMGGGTEISLGCHYRIAAPGALIGLPEVKIGLLPGAGGTQRLPRVAGVALALEMIVSGDAVRAERLLGNAIDRIIDSDFLAGALAFAKEMVARGTPHPRVRDIKLDRDADAALLTAARAAASNANFPAPLKCIDAIEAAMTMDFDAGLAREFALFKELMATPESAALRHVFFAERAATKIADVPESTPTRPIATVAVIGAGTMGGGIAMNFLNAGMAVTLLETRQDALDRGLATIRRNYEASVGKGKLGAEQYSARMALLTPTLDYADVAAADLVIEAVFEEFEVKRGVFETLDRVMKPGAILASNTSTLDLNRLAATTRRPADVIGLHFFSPANVMRLLEVVRGSATAPEVLATVMKLAKKIRKTAVVSGVCDGFIGNRMLAQYLRQAMLLLDEGASVEAIDQAIEQFGFAMGPFRMSDLAGNDIGWAIRKRRYREQPALKYSKIGDRLCELGRFGQKAGGGWYDYRAGDRNAQVSPVVRELLDSHRQSIGIAPRAIEATEIVERLVYALVNEGARILDEGIAARASDIDLIYLTGYGFPTWRGGPMHYADRVGLAEVATVMRRFAANHHDDAGFWTPAAPLTTLAATGATFNPRFHP